ncbi:MAG: hypothetical protein N0A16_06970 [Blastocatellia bacterium]|nr:hypothetical protein [Blastocatellia bacterium]MCS7157452.1 hypothetical protein [Blastocatellia bacterium]MCX7752625.1 hypothetical protein [Blastocatellia bacterium]MDW8168356.1 hypothetical protein [Acidobacteriota bacterium]MDW8255552.1 hypothetical protein [Acidobacteriota bacterium]
MMRKVMIALLLLLSIARPLTLKAEMASRLARDRNIPIGEVIANGSVFLNGVRVTSGSTVFNGASLRTAREARAILALRAGAGVIALLPESEARVREVNRTWTIELAQGEILVRAREATEVICEGVRVRSPYGNGYRLTTSGEGIRVDALENPVMIHAAGEELRLSAGQSLLLHGGTAQVAPQSPQPRRARRNVVLPALVLGALVVTLALTVARGERSKVVSPVAPQR